MGDMIFADIQNKLETFLLGDAHTKEILKPGMVSISEVRNCPVTKIPAMRDTPVIWVARDLED